MNNRPVFEAEHNCICAYADHSILEFYKGYYESVYIILNPFTKLNKATIEIEKVKWKDFLKISGLKDINQLDIALRNSISGLNQKYLEKENLSKLNGGCENHGLTPPSEGEFPKILINDFLASLLDLEHQFMFVADEHGFERKLVYIQEVINDPDKVELKFSGHENWYTNKHEVLYTTHWDSFYSLLCSDRQTINTILKKYPFEGFFCDHNTEIYWSLKKW